MGEVQLLKSGQRTRREAGWAIGRCIRYTIFHGLVTLYAGSMHRPEAALTTGICAQVVPSADFPRLVAPWPHLCDL